MSTSLFEQLERLKAPHLGAIADAKRKASILFEPKEAASKDRKTIYDLGIHGLQELIALNSNFQQFEQTLFEENTLHMERAVEIKEVNDLLNKNIKKFLQHLSPYFLLRPAHLCLEWLIRRFQVHDYNRNELMSLVLPYHETNAFVKVIQTFRLNASDKEWLWLKPLQKPGKTLAKSVIINKAATDKGFFAFICNSTLDSIKEMGAQAYLLQTQLNFYASVVVGALETASTVQEWHVATLLLSLLKGLKSETIDFVSAAYIITARLVARTQIKPTLCRYLLTEVAKVRHERLKRTAVLLLIWIMDTQKESKPSFEEETLIYLVQQNWLLPTLAALAKENLDIQSVIVPLMEQSVLAFMSKHSQMAVFQTFLESILKEVVFSTVTAQNIISSFLDCYTIDTAVASSVSNSSLQDGDLIELDSDDDEVSATSDANLKAWYTQYLQKLERQYPQAFDVTLKETMSNSRLQESANRRKALKMVLGYRLQSVESTPGDIYESLYHHTASVRLIAVKSLLKNFQKYKKKPQNSQILKDCIANRICDDSEEIVKEVLKLPTTDILEILDTKKFVEALIEILYKAQVAPQQWLQLCPKVVKHLTCEQVISQYDNNLVILSLMPLIFPINAEATSIKALEEIIKSPLTERASFLKKLQVKGENFNLAEYKREFLDVISVSPGTPSVVALFDSVESQGDNYFKQAMQLYHFLMLLTASLRDNYSAKNSLQIFTRISKYTQKFQVKSLEKQEWQIINKTHYIPLQLYSDFLVNLTAHTNFQSLEKSLWESPEELHFFLNIIEYVTEECFGKSKDLNEQAEWSKILKNIFDAVFKQPTDKVDFLVNFYVYDEQLAVKDYPVLRVRAFKLLQALVKGNNKSNCQLQPVHILKISVALLSSSQIVRVEALATLKYCLHNDLKLDDNFKLFINCLLERSEEIIMDCEQYPLILYILLKGESKNRQKSQMASKVLKSILTILKQDETLNEAVFTHQLLSMIIHINDELILSDLVSLGCKSVKRSIVDREIQILLHPYAGIYTLICDRFSNQSIQSDLFHNDNVWKFMEIIFENHQTFMTQDKDNLKPLTCIFLEALNENTLDRMPGKFREKFLMVLIQTLALAENDTIFLAANKLLKKSTLDCKSLAEIIENMYKSCLESTKPESNRKRATKRESNQSPIVQINDLTWKQGIVLMELLENKKRLENTSMLVPPLFELLNCCLAVEEQTTVEYTKQLVLSALLNCCQKAAESGNQLEMSLPKTTFRIDNLVQCLRVSQNPQTHHNALLFLSHCANLFPQQVLHNIVDIFTFMGSSVVRHDDAFSFHIINNIIISVVPILVKDKSALIPVLKVFSDILLDVPEHRRLPLYTKLLMTLGVEEYLWMFLCVVFEAHVIDDEKQRLLQKTSGKSAYAKTDQVAKRIEIALEISNTFTPEIVLETTLQLMKYIEQLPMQKEEKQGKKTSSNAEKNESMLFDVNSRSGKQLRHYKYVIMQYLSAITASHEFLKKIALLSGEEVNSIKPYYQNMIISILSFVPSVSLAIEKSEEASQQKFWKVILHHLHDVLDNTISLLSGQIFLAVVNGLLQHQLLSVRKKVIELLITKLQQKDTFFDNVDGKHFLKLLKPLSDIIAGIVEKKDSGDMSHQNEMVFLQQTALIAIKLLSKLLALEHKTEMKEILTTLTKTLKQRKTLPKILLATVVLTMIEISSNLKAHSIAHLPKFMPHLLDVLHDQSELLRHQPPDNVCVAILTGMQKLFEALPLFLGPYTVDIITALSSIGTRIKAQNNEKDQKSLSALQKISTIWSKIAKDLPLRILVPSCDKAYSKLLASKNYEDIQVLMNLLNQAIKNAENKDLTVVHSEVSGVFTQALEFRLQMKNTNIKLETINIIECSIIEAFVSWVLKLSESSFRPLYHKLYNWALQQTQQPETILTYFLLTHRIAESLKSLFVLFADNFIEDSARLLNEYNTNKTDIVLSNEGLATELLKAVLNTLYNIFLYDSKEFINAQRFEYLMPAIVNQLENRLVLEQEELQQILSNCISQLAVDVSNDVLWKQLNYQVLLKTRTNVPEIRMFAFNCCVEIARKLGEDFTPLLPETVPFIAELFEDENPRVEKSTRKSVQELEVILGESLQKYL